MKYSIKVCAAILVGACVFVACKKNNKKNQEEITEPPKQEWISLFNGKDLNDWVIKINGYPLNENIHNTYRVEDSVLKVSYDGYDKFGTSFGHIFYKKPFSSYRLKMQYRFVGEQVADGQEWAKRNSGVMIHSQDPKTMEIDQGFPVCIEVQFLGGVQEGVERPTANLCTPGTHVLMDDELITEHCISSSSETYYGEEWVNMEVLVYNDSLISHRVNGKEVIRYSKPIFGGKFTPENEDWKAKEGQPLTEGYIALQSESHPIEFRNIKLLNLDK